VAHSSPISSATLGTAVADPTVVEVLRVEEPTPGEGRRHVVVRWSDGSTGRALSYFANEILVSEGDMVGRRPPSCERCTSRAIANTFRATTDACAV
jgi:hypothetical protein